MEYQNIGNLTRHLVICKFETLRGWLCLRCSTSKPSSEAIKWHFDINQICKYNCIEVFKKHYNNI